LITVARDHHEFVVGIEQALARGRQPLDERQLETLHRHSWPARAEHVIGLIAAALQQVEHSYA
jgi:hypothetical protein